jgi:hypothetical protein
MMISGAHVVIYSTKPDDDRAFLRDVLKLPNVDAGGGWLIFGLPPSEAAVHPAPTGDRQELYLLTDRIDEFVEEMHAHGVVCDSPRAQPWGTLTTVHLPGGGRIGVYEPRHARPGSLERLTD